MTRFASLKDLRHRLARRLVERGILRADERKILFLFTQKIYPELNPKPEQAVMKRLREAIMTDAREVDARTVVLVSLAWHTGILRVVFDKKDLKRRKERIEKVINGDVLGKATKQAIEAVQAAIAASIAASTVIAATVSTSS